MIIFRLINLIRGYAIIKLDVTNYEKILNLLRRKGISMWDIEKTEHGINFKISYDDYSKYQNLMKEINLHTVKKSGLAINLRKIIFRKGFATGILVLIICYFVFASLIWQVEIIGVNHTTFKEIVKVLNENDIKTPTFSTNINKNNIETLLYKYFDNFKFIEVYIEGSKLIIFVKEKESAKFEVEKDTPSSIISTKNAIVNKVIAKSGQPVVKEGDVVYEGQTLVMGIVKNKNSDDFMMVPSEGIVYGKTYYNFILKENKLKDITVSTNNSKSVYYLKNNEKKVKIIGDIEPFENYNYKETSIKLPIITNFSNITIEKGVYYEEKAKEIKIDENTAKNKLKVSMYDDLLKKCNNNARILQSSLKFSEDDDYYYLNAQIEIIEDIGEKIRIYPIDDKTTEEIRED
ncbi:sporulation protein YqfD [Sedimentibacter sp. MB31-C6]|uniref:sporulation protein YqfD n=1 Tax=Sedimentibacter sp. MB31-C6 TaxID=3109366 RepID=UPI002DDC9CF1|nr:sporulation protein YqfD [Sedimentibacter sp. MB36-C1]WSI04161.1 sporulation protein YqfD [Sedimentibacter sp. MB36-C1]